MEKLIELLNKYELSKTHIDYTWKIEDKSEKRMCGVEYTGAYVNEEEMERIVISKKYMFIQWLVDNDKIDFKNTDYELYRYDREDNGNLVFVSKYQELLMLLSIQDNPIEFLVSILK